MTPQELYNTTPRQFHNRLNGWREAKETERRERWEQTRVIAYNTVLPYLKSKDSNYQKFMPFSWDKVYTMQLPISEADSRQRYKLKLMRHKMGKQVIFNDEYEALIRQHYQPDWGPHPDELVKNK